ncbi:MAG: hypothetical protein ACRDNS_34660, partial [Trebonia sp.]
LQGPTPADGGAYLTDFAQKGTSRVYGINGGPAILSIDALAPGNISFDPSGGLYGPTTWLVLTFGQPSTPGGTLGTATGQVFVKSLDVFAYGAGGSTNLFGSVDQVVGQPAAGKANIAPGQNPLYRINNCPIGSVGCAVLPIEGLPSINRLQNLPVSTTGENNRDDTLLLPIVSERDFYGLGGSGEGAITLPIVSSRDYPSVEPPCEEPQATRGETCEQKP